MPLDIMPFNLGPGLAAIPARGCIALGRVACLSLDMGCVPPFACLCRWAASQPLYTESWHDIRGQTQHFPMVSGPASFERARCSQYVAFGCSWAKRRRGGPLTHMWTQPASQNTTNPDVCIIRANPQLARSQSPVPDNIWGRAPGRPKRPNGRPEQRIAF